MYKKVLLSGAGVAIVIIAAVCLLFVNKDNNKDNVQNGEKLNVVASFNAMYEFSTAVGGSKVNVSTIIPDGAEPHEFEPKANDLVALSKADLFVYNGLGMESWADKAIESSQNSKLVGVVASKDVSTIKLAEEQIEEHGEFDPHTWLSLENAILEVNTIKDAFVQADEKNKGYYEQNANDFTAKLQDLYKDYKDKFASAPSKVFVTGHAAFGYLARDFGLTQNSVEDTFAEGEPSPSQLTELVDYCKENNVKVIFAEEMVAPDVSNTLAREVGAKVETIYTIESNEDSLGYVDRLRHNLDKIYNSLNA
jgi:zinc transport system substrate-binding protein